MHAEGADPAALDGLRKALAENEASRDNVMLVYFNQGVVTGDWDGPHISPIGAYDAEKDRVLVMDVDRHLVRALLDLDGNAARRAGQALPADQGVLAGGTGGYVLVTKP